jgi:hypothetical protein
MHSVRLLLLLVFALLSSCAKQGIRHDLKQMMSQPIVMPDELEMVLADTVIACVQSASSKCIVYLDSADCMCLLNQSGVMQLLYGRSVNIPHIVKHQAFCNVQSQG